MTDNGLPAALTHPVGAQLAEALAAGPACVSQLVAELRVSQPSVVNQLRAMRHDGLAARERREGLVFYRLVPEVLERLAAGLDGEEADALTSLAERSRDNSLRYRGT